MLSNSLYSPLSLDDDCDNIGQDTEKRQNYDHDSATVERKHRRHKRDRHRNRRSEVEDEIDNEDQFDPKPKILSSRPLVPEYDDFSDIDDIHSQSFDDQRNDEAEEDELVVKETEKETLCSQVKVPVKKEEKDNSDSPLSRISSQSPPLGDEEISQFSSPSIQPKEIASSEIANRRSPSLHSGKPWSSAPPLPPPPPSSSARRRSWSKSPPPSLPSDASYSKRRRERSPSPPGRHSERSKDHDSSKDYSDRERSPHRIKYPSSPTAVPTTSSSIKRSYQPPPDMDINDPAYKKFIASKFGEDLPEQINIVDVNVSQYLRGNTELIKAVSMEKAPEVKGPAPNPTAKRKHQITYLAFQAQQRELDLKNQAAANRFTKAQTKKKYGF